VTKEDNEVKAALRHLAEKSRSFDGERKRLIDEALGRLNEILAPAIEAANEIAFWDQFTSDIASDLKKINEGRMSALLRAALALLRRLQSFELPALRRR
jgi:hypothetical protein